MRVEVPEQSRVAGVSLVPDLPKLPNIEMPGLRRLA